MDRTFGAAGRVAPRATLETSGQGARRGGEGRDGVADVKRILWVVPAVVGVLLLAAAAVVQFVVAPAKAVLPSDTDTTRTYAGTAATLFNAQALGTGGQVLRSDVPITVVHRTKVLETKDGNALVSDGKTVTAGSTTVAAVQYRYAVDRTSLAAGSGFSDVVEQHGITFNWPVRTNDHSYTGWISDTHATTTLSYKGTAKRGGLTCAVFTTTTKPAPITDSQVLGALPAGLPKQALAGLVGALGLPAATVAAVQAALPTLPDTIPLQYTYQVGATYWVAPTSGIVVDLEQHEVRSLVMTIGGQAMPAIPVMDLTFSDTPATLTAAVQDARDKASGIDLLYRWLPLWLAVGGGVLVLAGVAWMAFPGRRRPTAGPGGGHERIEPVGTSGP